MQQKIFKQIINELCEEKNIKITSNSFDWITNLTKNNITKHIIRNQLEINSASSYIIANDKYATYSILSSNNIPVIEHKMIFNPKTRSSYYQKEDIEDVYIMLDKYKKIVIKENDSCKGKGVFCCSNKNEVNNLIDFLFENNNNNLSICPYLDIDYEYRNIYLDGEILYTYKKEKPYVIGNGINTVKELINEKFPDNIYEIEVDEKIKLDYIPQKYEKVIIFWKHNLNCGAEVIVVDDNDEFLEKVKEIAKNAASAINIKFATIDVAVTKNKQIFVMEVNASVCMNKFVMNLKQGYKITKNIFSKAIDKMFE